MKSANRLLFICLILLLTNVSNVFAQALNFGAYSYITIGNILSSNHSYTKEAWVKVYPTTSTHGRNFISSYDHPFWLENGVLSAANSYGSFPHKAILRDTEPLPLSTWVHIAVTYDANNAVMTLYKNGKVVATDLAAPGYNMGVIQLGAMGSGNFLEGVDMDEVRIWGVALTQIQILANMNCDVTSQEGLLAYYKFDEGNPGQKNTDVLSAVDYSGHSNNGLFANFSFMGNDNNYVGGHDVHTAGIIKGATAGCIDEAVSLSDALAGGAWSSTNPAVATVSPGGKLTGVSSGNTVISYTLNNGCYTTKTLNVYSSPVVSGIATSESNTGSDGGVSTQVSGGQAPYKYSWSNNATTPDITGVREGIYKVMVSDKHGCTASGAYIVTRPASGTYSAAEIVPANKPLAGAQQP